MVGFIQPNVNEIFAWLEKVRRDSARDILILGDRGRADFFDSKKDQTKDIAFFLKKRNNWQLVKIKKEILRNHWENIVGISEKERIYNVKNVNTNNVY